MAEMLQPGAQIKPILTVDGARELVERLYGVQVTSIKEMEAYDDKNYHIQVVDPPSNPHLVPLWPHGYVFKVLNSMDSRKVDFVEAQNEMMLYLGAKGIRCTEPVKNVNGAYHSLETLSSGPDGAQYVARLLTFQPGDILYAVDATPELCREVGQYLARIDTALEGFNHAAYDSRWTIWALECAPQLPKFLFAVKDEAHVQLVLDILAAFERLVIPVKAELPSGMIHGDFNEHNILVQLGSDNAWHVDGVLDFGDTQRSCYLFEVALAACYMLLQAKPPLSPIRAAALTVAGYHQLRPLSERELSLIQVCVCARLCQSLVLGVYSHLQDPGNEYVLQTAKSGTGWRLMAEAWAEPAERFMDTLRREINSST